MTSEAALQEDPSMTHVTAGFGPQGWGEAGVQALTASNTEEDKKLGQRFPVGESGLHPRAGTPLFVLVSA